MCRSALGIRSLFALHVTAAAYHSKSARQISSNRESILNLSMRSLGDKSGMMCLLSIGPRERVRPIAQAMRKDSQWIHLRYMSLFLSPFFCVICLTSQLSNKDRELNLV